MLEVPIVHDSELEVIGWWLVQLRRAVETRFAGTVVDPVWGGIQR
jgi:hypothetical protein